jgi:hypothetical protein
MAMMGIGEVGKKNTIIKRKFRFLMDITYPGGYIPPHFVKVAGRPKLSIDSTEINFLNATTWIPGKPKWEPISVTYIDVAHSDMGPLLNWITTIYDFQHELTLQMSEKSGWSGTANIYMLDGCGSVLETWSLKSCYPESVDFGTLEYANSEEATIELTLRYSEVEQNGLCGSPKAVGTCTGCG